MIVGGGFIGSECLANLAKTYKDKKTVSMLCDTNVPMEKIFGYDIGAMLLTEH